MLNTADRIDYILQLAKQYKIDGVIYYALKFCDTHLLDFPLVKKELNKSGFPILFLEGDSLMPSSGQIKTRIKAFLEVFNCAVK
jgi:benzoyl-CoA reductase/2-hydroxyglutaryl-CoA dehydratase subunit BcrC/BadD/HgdB